MRTTLPPTRRPPNMPGRTGGHAGRPRRPAGTSSPRELALRESDGIEATLLWYEDEDRLAVSVHDTRLGTRFEVPAPAERALHVFHHPYAYAARHGIEYDVPGDGPERGAG